MISSGSPVTSVHPGPPPSFCAQALSRAGVSAAGSMLTEISWTSRPARSPSSFRTLAKVAPRGGQMVVQVVNTKFIITTLPCTRSL